jgi:acetyl esterase/lipase
MPHGWKASAPEVTEPQDHMGGITIIKQVNEPTLSYFKPQGDAPQGRAVVICPGGAYRLLAWDLEGTEVATWLSGLGYHAFVLKYRLPREGDVRHAAALEDAQRALSLVRANAATWKIQPEKIGIMGFSAGGHLAALTSARGDVRAYTAADSIDALPCAPNFSILIYSAYGLVGDKATGPMAPEFTITPSIPPAFLAHAIDDPVPVANAFAWAAALHEHKVPAELHVYPDGGHGYGLRSDKSVKAWPTLLADWLKRLP